MLEDIESYAPATIELASCGFAIALVFGIPLGILSAVKRDTWIDHLARVISLLGVASPTFWLAFIMLAVFYGWLQIAPGPGRLDPIAFPPPAVTGFYLVDTLLARDWNGFWDAVSHLMLPSIVLAAATIGLITRTTRASMLDCIRQDYVRMGRAKGLKERHVIMRHAWPNALIPVVTLGGLGLRQPAHRRGFDRNDLLMARTRPVHLHQRFLARFPGHHGYHARRRDCLSGCQFIG